jgi:hemoglobin
VPRFLAQVEADSLSSAAKEKEPMDIRRLSITGLVVLGIAWSSACAAKKPPPPIEPTTEEPADAGVEEAEAPAPKSLYERLGKKEGIAKVVDTFVKNVQPDPRIKGAAAFKGMKADKIEKFKTNMVDFVCKETGGDCTYGGKSMKDVHKNMKITEAMWDAVVEDLKLALTENKVAEEDQKELLEKLGPLKGDIVDPKTVKPPKK